MDSILTSIKKMIGGIAAEDTTFDTDIIIHINSALSILTQEGVGPASGFSIEDSTATWTDFLGNDPNLASAKSYVYLKVKLLFDPPLSSAHIEAINKQIAELEWRLFVATDPAS